MRTYTGKITILAPHEIFVFGSNTQGRHGKGAALTAMRFGAIYGQAKGLQGRAYGIVTKDLTAVSHPSISKNIIADQILELYKFAGEHPENDFVIAYSCAPNLNGYTPKEMAQLFIEAAKIIPYPDNLVFEVHFHKLILVHQMKLVHYLQEQLSEASFALNHLVINKR